VVNVRLTGGLLVFGWRAVVAGSVCGATDVNYYETSYYDT